VGGGNAFEQILIARVPERAQYEIDAVIVMDAMQNLVERDVFYGRLKKTARTALFQGQF
jgi:hypothetical protein